VRAFGNHVFARDGASKPNVFHVFQSHLHWDHIMGFPFFAPAYVPGNRIRIYGCHRNLEEALRRQQDPPSFPVPFDRLGASIEFVTLQPGRIYDIAGWSVTAKLQSHSGDSYGYRFVRDGRIIVYSTDSEHRLDDPNVAEAAATFFADADLVIFDAMYSLAEAVSVKEDWGHSSNVVGVELCQLANVKHLVLFHHEPANNDERIGEIWRETLRYEEISRTGEPLRVTAAYDGLEIEL
jgi:phosphoribosyl 1,2-cyclic phosphodiesterase